MGVHLRDGGAAVACYRPQAEVVLAHCAFIDGVNLETAEALKAQIEAWGLTGCGTSFVLGSRDYQLLLVEAPAVDDSELAEALKWRVKDLVSYDINDAVIDYVALPEDAYRGRSKMLYVAVMQKALSARVEAFTKAAGLALDAIDVPELALLNLLQLVEAESTGMALLALQSGTSFVDLIGDDALYLTRSIETPKSLLAADAEDIESAATSVILDIQRSLDYYESQIGKPPCMKLLVCPLQPGQTPLLSQFSYNLPVELVQLDLGELLSSAAPLTPELQGQCVIAIAGALRGVQRT